MLGDKANDVLGDRHLEMIDHCLVTQDRYAMLEIRELDIRDHSPLEAAHQTGFQTWDLRGRPIAGQDDLPACLVECVEGVEELLLGRFLSLQKLDVIDQKQVGFSIAPAKLLRR